MNVTMNRSQNRRCGSRPGLQCRGRAPHSPGRAILKGSPPGGKDGRLRGCHAKTRDTPLSGWKARAVERSNARRGRRVELDMGIRAG